MKIRFTRDYAVKDAAGTRHAAGDVLDCSEATAAHFINRGAAVADEHKPTPRRQATVTPPRRAVIEPGEGTTARRKPDD